MPLESILEEIIETDPTILGDPIMLIGRQVPTAFGKYIDLLGVDADGAIHVLELKRDRTPREVVAQTLDYGSWIGGLSHEDVLEIFGSYRQDVAFEQAFSLSFGTSPPEELNSSHRLTIVASELDAATSRIVEYLTDYGVPVNVLFFRYFEDAERHYVARTWLIDEVRPRTGTAGTKQRSSTKEPWNGQDWYVSFGEESGLRNWDDARELGFVSAGGGRWFSRTLQALPVGGRVFVCIPKVGYVGVGEVAGDAQRFDQAVLTVGDQEVEMKSLPLKGTYRHTSDAEDNDECVVPVRWTRTLPRESAIWEKGMFANQNSACKLRNRFTIQKLTKRFGLEET